MITLNKTLLISTCLFAGISTSAVAIEDITTVCVNGSNIRIVEVIYPGESAVPCEVQYTKKAGTQTLWTAKESVGFCESQAAKLVEKQKNWGWTCETDFVAMPEETSTEY